MTKRLSIDITVYDDETHTVEERRHYPESSSFAWEIEREFERLGEEFGRLLDPTHYKRHG